MPSAEDHCQVCELPVRAEANASVCRHCATVFHPSCLESVNDVCAHCGGHCHGEAAASTNPFAEDPTLKFVAGGFQRAKPSTLYRVSLVLVTIGMILLPMIYLGLIASCAFGVLNCAIGAAKAMSAADYGIMSVFGMLIFYVAPILVGTLIVVSLIKPLFAPSPPAPESFPLNHADAPRLFALIGWICRSLNAPMPSRVDVDCSVNAGAGFRGGFRSIFDNDIALSVGLPLAAGMNLSQFAGVIAHEYGHFSQGAGMRAQFLIRHINGWFYRAVYERDAWDLALEEYSEPDREHWRVVIIVLMARLGIACGRGIIWLLMVAGNVLSSFMFRQMERDADQYEIKLCGSQNFVSTVLRLQQLNLGFAIGQKQLVTKWKKEKKLFDQVPDFIVSRANEISAEAQERHYAQALNRRTQLFDAYPSDAERVAQARAAAEPGIFHETAPATTLFADYPGLSRRLTQFFYRDLAGREFHPELLPTHETEKERTDDSVAAERQQMNDWFGGMIIDSQPIILRENKSLLFRRDEALRAEVQVCRRLMEKKLPSMREAFANYTAAETRQSQARQAAQLLAAGFQFDPCELSLSDLDADDALADAAEIMRESEVTLRPFIIAAQNRLMDLVLLLRLPQNAALIPHAVKLQDEAKEMIWISTRLGDLSDTLLTLRNDCAVLEILLRYHGAQPSADNAVAALEVIAIDVQEGVNALQEQTRQMRYPFTPSKEQLMLSEHLRNREYHADPFELALREGRSHVEKLFELHRRVLARLVAIGVEVERVID